MIRRLTAPEILLRNALWWDGRELDLRKLEDLITVAEAQVFQGILHRVLRWQRVVRRWEVKHV